MVYKVDSIMNLASMNLDLRKKPLPEEPEKKPIKGTGFHSIFDTAMKNIAQQNHGRK